MNGLSPNTRKLKTEIINNLNFDIFALSETKFSNDDQLHEFTNSYHIIYHNRRTIHRDAPTASGGVAILLAKSVFDNFTVETLDNTFEGILVIKLINKYTKSDIIIAACYLPPEGSARGRDASSFFTHLLQTVYLYSETDKLLILGDFNARIGILEDTCDSFDDVPPRKINIDTTINQHGREFIDFMLDARMAILNGRNVNSGNNAFCTDNRYTFVAGRGSSVVDYMCIPYDNFPDFSNFAIHTPNEIVLKYGLHNLITSGAATSDHNILVADINMSYTVQLRNEFANILNNDNPVDFRNEAPIYEKRYNDYRVKWKSRMIPDDFLSNNRVQNALHGIIDNLMLQIDTQSKIDDIYCNLIDLLNTELWNTVPHFLSDKSKRRYRINKPFWNQHLQSLWNDLYNVETYVCSRHMNKGAKKRIMLEYRKKLNEFDRYVRYYKRKYNRGEFLNLEKLTTDDPNKFWNHISKLGPPRNRHIPEEIINESNIVINDKNLVYQKWTSDWQQLFSPTSNSFDEKFYVDAMQRKTFLESLMLDPLYNPNPLLNTPITMEELKLVLLKSKDNKATGWDNIPNEVWKLPALNELLLALFQACFDSGLTPSEWSESVLLPIPKSSNSNDLRTPLCYRPISLVNCISKIYSAILNQRITQYLDIDNRFSLEEEQNGFRKKRSCLDHIYSLHSIISNQLDKKENLYAAFIDFQKAFDSVDRNLLKLRLLDYKIDGNMYHAICSLLKANKIRIHINDDVTNWFDACVGVRQGDNLSPTLFNVFINDLIRTVKNTGKGLFVKDRLLNILVYADDIVVFATSPDDLQAILNAITEWTKKWRLTVNNKKTKVVHFRPARMKRSDMQFTISNQLVEIVDKYKYLGLLFDEHLKYQDASNALSVAGGRALGSLISKFKNLGNLGFHTYTKYMENCVYPILDYACAIWGSDQHKKPDQVQERAMRYFLGVHKFTPIPGLRGDMGWYPFRYRWLLEKSRLYNHLVQMNSERIPGYLFQNLENTNSWKNNFQNHCNLLLSDIDQFSFGSDVIDITKFLQEIKLNCSAVWKQQVLSKPKLRTYLTYKSTFGTDPYVTANLSRQERSRLAQIRLGIAPLQLELGRYNNTPVNERTCKLCTCNVVEDEYHFMLVCPTLARDRGDLLHSIYRINPNFNNLTIKEKWIIIFSNHLIYKTSKYINQALSHRQDILYKT